MVRILFLACLLIFSLPANSQIKKWVDKDGKVHYGDQPPPGVTEQKANIKVSPAPAPAASPEGKAAGPQTAADQELEFKKRRIAAEEAEKKSATEGQENAQKCAQAKSRLASVQFGRVYKPDEKGERAYLDDKQIQQEIGSAQKDIDSFCK